jgi:catechol 2,3-dioxygenase-like lactoylglutathione lyase family enzyme
MNILGIDHVQLAMPAGGESQARAFYADLLGLPEKTKPAELAARGGVWFESARVRIHLGVEKDFRPAKKAHPGLLVEGLAALTARLRAAGFEVVDQPFDETRRAFVHDPFGNRIELIDQSE